MAAGFLDIPFELKYKIAASIAPLEVLKTDFTAHSCCMSSDELESVQPRFRDLRNFAMACSDTRGLCKEFLSQVVELIGEESHIRFLRRLCDGTLPDSIQDTSNVKFLSFGGFALHDSTEHGCDDYCSELQEQDDRIRRILAHFPCITTLHLVNVPLSILTVKALFPTQALRTLIIVNPQPNPRDTYSNFTLRCDQTKWYLPQIANVSVVMGDSRASASLSNIISLFKESITSLSLRSEQRGLVVSPCGALERATISLGDTCCTWLLNLKHLSMGYLRLTPFELGYILPKGEIMDSLSVDFRGALEQSLPMVYILELMESLAGDDNLLSNFQEYYWKRGSGRYHGPYRYEDDIMHRPVIHFSGTFSSENSSSPYTSQGSPKYRKVKSLQLTFQDNDEYYARIDAAELLKLVRKRSPTLNELDENSFMTSVQFAGFGKH
ncbi:uncharacterized protein FOMMEDRAFT_160403 [Fomitiporia mediterranea MF3/22]|uniref:uncharacterized protein n=1 Tax=Fomitiporia mediterranea (strain MF3/22) TaxID=694068 RepID=UPI0004407A3F|nr:uncharacterized protein FOMMEDRAFT_160403 [Fomitiporia mediterranea MF3/22]EJC99928.1 hypothetical protein FOMMEDRAFT_160403 [Fomitiporia mediterranea MF3/22]